MGDMMLLVGVGHKIEESEMLGRFLNFLRS